MEGNYCSGLFLIAHLRKINQELREELKAKEEYIENLTTLMLEMSKKQKYE